VFAFVKTGPGMVLSVLAGVAAGITAWTTIEGRFIGPKLEVSWVKCDARELVVRIRNSGGRPATYEPPRFTIVVPGVDGPRPLDPVEFDAPAPKGGTIAPREAVNPPFRASLDYFRPEWATSGQCRIQVIVPNNTDQPEIAKDCACAHRP
jgi:hypothetical protein